VAFQIELRHREEGKEEGSRRDRTSCGLFVDVQKRLKDEVAIDYGISHRLQRAKQIMGDRGYNVMVINEVRITYSWFANVFSFATPTLCAM
jgi:hypothetical protein